MANMGVKLRERTLIAIGGMLHDIGKIVQRSGEGRGWKKEEHEKDFQYEHAYLSHAYMEEHIKPLLSEGYDIVEASSRHHAPKENIYQLLYKYADYYGSSERSKKTAEEKIPQLRPIFLEVGGDKKDISAVYDLSPLSLEEKVLFSKEAVDILVRRYEGKKPEEELREKYKRLLQGFTEELKAKQSQDSFLFLERLYHLFYKYFWCVPASTWDMEKKDSHYPDISLFDHSRVVSALATSLWTDYNLGVIEEYKEYKELGKNLKFVLIDGDITGIQSFLYNLTNMHGVSKRLRGKSFFLTLLPELVGRALLQKLEYPYVNLIYSGGGKFWALVGYEENLQEKLKNFQKELERKLISEFGGELGFVLSFEVFNALELRQEQDKSLFYPVVRRLYQKVAENKKRKFLNTLAEFEELANGDMKGETPKVLCPSCRSVLIEQEKEVCRWCKAFEDVGSFLPEAKYVIFSSTKREEEGYFLEGFGGFYLTENPLEGFVYSINSTQMEGVAGFKFFANTVPIVREKNDGDNPEKERVMNFEEMVEGEEGYQKLGYVRADVDNLGYIFSEGLREDYSISRIATLSRSLDLFFSGYLNRLLEDKFKNQVYVVYAGGDDLFIIAHWEKALDAIEEIHEDFKAYTCHKKIFDLSCGMSLADPKHPIRFGAEEAGEEEERAKKNKPAIRSLGETLKWDEFSGALKDAKDFLKKHGLKVGRTMVYRIYTLLRLYEKEDGEVRMKFYPLFYYFINRNIKDDKLREDFVNLLIDIDNQYKVRKSARFILKYILMKTRGVSGKLAEGGLLKEEVER